MPDPVARYALRIAYDGGPFNGWQTQPDRLAIQDRVEAALSQICGGKVSTICAGRTDAGVHALAQVIHFDSPVKRPLTAWTRGVNALLPPEIAVQQACEVDEGFHARFGAVRRAYTYRILRAPLRHPMMAGRAGWVFQPLDVARMAQAAGALLGEHDFSAFRSSQCQAKSPVRRMDLVSLREQGSELVIDLQANAFLHHMVRNIVGALVWVGLGRRPPEWLAQLLASRDRTTGAPTFAPQGLTLTGVDYAGHGEIGAWPPLSGP